MNPAVVRRALEVARATAVGCGQILFCESPASGVLFLFGIGLLSPLAAAAGAAGGVVSSLVALKLRYPTGPWRSGLYGYPGVLLGLFWVAIFAPGLTTGLGLLTATALAAPLTRLAHRFLTPRNLPALALPMLVLTWPAVPFLPPAAAGPPHPLELQILSWALVLIGIAIYSRMGAISALSGGAAGAALGVLLTGAIPPGFLSNSVPTAMALCGIFVPWSLPALALAAAGAAHAAIFWWATAPGLDALGLPALVAPFNLVTLLTLLGLRVSALRRWVPQRPAPLPLASVGRPEQTRGQWLQRRRLQQLVRAARRICVLTGAGVSTEAGLPDYRTSLGFWTSSSPITIGEFWRSPEARRLHWEQEERFFALVQRARPAATHYALVNLYHQGRLAAVITQNVDRLHQAAGLPPSAVIELHGAIAEPRCVDCSQAVSRASLSPRIRAGAGTFYCERCRGHIKSGCVLFGEEVEPARLQAAMQALLASDLLLVLGTSLAVTPASDLIRWAAEGGIPLAIVNATPTPADARATVTVTADVGTVMLDLVEEVKHQAAGHTGAILGTAGRRRASRCC